MKAFAVGGAALSFAILGAHFYRQGLWIPVAACAALLALLAWRRPWVPRVVQAALALGVFEWLWTAFTLAQERIAMGRPWTRLAVILGLVAVVCAASAWAMGRVRIGGSRTSRVPSEFA